MRSASRCAPRPSSAIAQTISSAFFRGALARSDLIILTGGLGPTDDDVTRDVVASSLELPAVEDAAISDAIRQRFARRGMTMPEINRRQAMVPRGRAVLPNANGTAPGLYIEAGDHVLVLLPGPPRELIPMLDGPVRERLAVARTAGTHALHADGARLWPQRVAYRGGRAPVLRASGREASPPIEVTILAARGAIDLHSRPSTRRRSRGRGAPQLGGCGCSRARSW